ncbi:MAG: Dihydrofolate reductase [Parcubacteria group bacterium GW2011_GWA1_50_14]|uniref:Dihydrofolate reductase n=1 Tax=uncultured Parcubacteria bacterium Rifle_16ft_4_minimus_37647 TaxID=1665140 RepID=A0A0H4TNY7_9BACT|nr:dihydrofolate reductase [uncultured Parcubacteria bacterium Rifle_16ft_4_minimus_37647]KKW16678.1 MAG: Dihydrofolate reductase [Parcubacteria group bacterium GW2011_GWA1_50_14]
MLISAIAAIGKNNVIGQNNDLVWKIPDDLARFREITKGHPVIMGRRTFESIGRPLPDRTNIVISREKDYAPEGVSVVYSVDEAIEKAKSLGNDEIFVIGGGEIYRQFMPYTDKLYLTIIDAEADGDVFFPDYSEFQKETFREERDYSGLKYAWVNLERD